jgi:uncharacterized membrane protein
MPTILHMDAVLKPTRSLPRTGLYVLLGALGTVNLLVASMFLLIGARPIPLFLGLDFAGIALAFWISNRDARKAERVQVSADEVHVMSELGRRRRTVWRSPTAFTRVLLTAPGQHEARLSLHMSQRTLYLGDRLSPQERCDFAEALKSAIAAARAERYTDPA